MDYQHEHSNDAKMASNSILQSDTTFLSRVTLSRQSTVGCSSRIYYRNTEGMPFKWEEEPGKPIEPQPDEVLPPLSPPPAVLSLGLPKPSIEVEQNRNGPTKVTVGWLWKQIKRRVKKGKDINKAIVEAFRRGKKRSLSSDGGKGPVYEGVEKVVETEGGCGDGDESHLWRFDGEMMRLAPRSSVSSSLSSSNSLSSSSSLISNAPSLEASKYHHPSFTCNPMNFGEIIVCFVKRS